MAEILFSLIKGEEHWLWNNGRALIRVSQANGASAQQTTQLYSHDVWGLSQCPQQALVWKPVVSAGGAVWGGSEVMEALGGGALLEDLGWALSSYNLTPLPDLSLIPDGQAGPVSCQYDFFFTIMNSLSGTLSQN